MASGLREFITTATGIILSPANSIGGNTSCLRGFRWLRLLAGSRLGVRASVRLGKVGKVYSKSAEQVALDSEKRCIAPEGSLTSIPPPSKWNCLCGAAIALRVAAGKVPASISKKTLVPIILYILLIRNSIFKSRRLGQALECVVDPPLRRRTVPRGGRPQSTGSSEKCG